MDFTNRAARQKKLDEANKQQNPRVKSIRLSGARLAVRIARMAGSSTSVEEMSRLAVAQSTVTTAMTIVEDDFQRANRLLDAARNLVNRNEPEATKDTANG